MRLKVVAVSLAASLVVAGGALHAQRADNQIDARSLSLMRSGESDTAAGNLVSAADKLETALAVDPRNRAAFIDLARVSAKQGLYGKAIRFYREALLLDPNDVVALSGQGEAMAAKGAMAKAREILAKVQKICGSASCAAASSLTAAIARGPVAAQTTASVAPPPAPKP